MSNVHKCANLFACTVGCAQQNQPGPVRKCALRGFRLPLEDFFLSLAEADIELFPGCHPRSTTLRLGCHPRQSTSELRRCLPNRDATSSPPSAAPCTDTRTRHIPTLDAKTRTPTMRAVRAASAPGTSGTCQAPARCEGALALGALLRWFLSRWLWCECRRCDSWSSPLNTRRVRRTDVHRSNVTSLWVTRKERSNRSFRAVSGEPSRAAPKFAVHADALATFANAAVAAARAIEGTSRRDEIEHDAEHEDDRHPGHERARDAIPRVLSTAGSGPV
jgi:hypothetical protein